MYTPCSVAGRVSIAAGLQLHVLLAVNCVGLLEVKSLMFVVVIASPEPVLLTEVVYIQLLVIIGVILEEETSVELQLQLGMLVTC